MTGSQTSSNGTRKVPIRRTPFTHVYRIWPDRIEILRLIDQRSGGKQSPMPQD
jgi:hypothetical protein